MANMKASDDSQRASHVTIESNELTREPNEFTREPTERTRVRRYPTRATYDRAAIDAILDEGMYCHVGFSVDEQPYVIPTIYVRDGDRILIHGSPMSRMLRTAAAGTPLCVTVTLVDGVVLARSAFHHSMNYRSVIVLGVAREVAEPEDKLAAMRALVDHLIPGRWAEVRTPTPGEIAGTIILELPIDEVSAKVRTGGPVDSEGDYALDVWAGHVPIRLTPADPIPDDRLVDGIAVPEYILRWRRPMVE
jgi:uncharacterized protein